MSATFVERQSFSFAGSDEDSSAFLRRCVSLCARAEMRVFISLTTFSSSTPVCALSSRFGESNRSVSALVSTCRTMARTAGVPSTSFVWPSNCGSGRRTVSTAVSPASTSSFSSFSFAPTLSRRAAASTWVFSTAKRPVSKPCAWVPPFGVVMMFTKLRVVVSYPVPQRRAMSTSHVRATSVASMWPFGCRTGIVSVKSPEPWMRQVSVSGASGARKSTNSEMPPSYRKVSTTGSPSRRSSTVMPSPGTRKAVCRARPVRSASENVASRTKICRSAQ